jgi:hypothetical protein
VNRKQFLKGCACTLCSCAVAGMTSSGVAAAESKPAEKKPAEDWRLPFVKKRFAKLMEILAGKMSDAELADTLRQMGSYCAGTSPLARQHRGDLDGYLRERKKRGNEDITYDPESGRITITGPECTDCFCPFMAKNLTPVKACDCSLGWHQYAFETVLGKKVRVELKESVLRGGKRCAFAVQVLK